MCVQKIKIVNNKLNKIRDIHIKYYCCQAAAYIHKSKRIYVKYIMVLRGVTLPRTIIFASDN